MSVGLYSHTTRGTGTVLTAAIYNSDHQNHITNQNPTMTGGYSDNVAQMQANTDPGGVGSESLAATVAAELERLRFAIKRITGEAQWYVAPDVDLATLALGPLVPLTLASNQNLVNLRRTENDTTERDITTIMSGSGAGDKAIWSLKGNGANGVADLILKIGGVERARFTSSIPIALTPPQGYLNPVSGTPIITADAAAATSVWYEPFVGNKIPLSSYMRTFSALELVLNNPNHAAATLYDVFADFATGVVRIGTGPAWSNSGAGTGARGTGAGTTELARSNGFWTNAVSMTLRNGASTYSINANEGLYLGTILTDGAGQVTCHTTWGQSRKWGVWNAFNRQPLYLKAGDSTASWTYNNTTVRAANGASANSLSLMSGLAEERAELEVTQNTEKASTTSGNFPAYTNGVGVNSTTVISGKRGFATHIDDSGQGGVSGFGSGTAHGKHLLPPRLGLDTITALESGDASVLVTIHGGEDDMMLSAKWRG